MALKLSTGLRNALLGAQNAVTIDTLAAVDIGNKITDSGSGLLAAGFRPNALIEVSGFTLSANNGLARITSVSAGEMVVTGLDLADEVEGDTVTITAQSKGFRDVFKNHIIRVYSGAAPATADLAETGTLLVSLTVSGGAFTPGVATNGLNFDAIAAGVLSKNSDVHSGTGVADGTAGYYRVYDNGEVVGSSSVAIRAQGTVGESASDFIMSSTTITIGATIILSTHNITLPAS